MLHFLKHSWDPQAFHLQQGFDISLLIISHRILQSGQFGGAIRFVRCSPEPDLHDRPLRSKEGRGSKMYAVSSLGLFILVVCSCLIHFKFIHLVMKRILIVFLLVWLHKVTALFFQLKPVFLPRWIN